MNDLLALAGLAMAAYLVGRRMTKARCTAEADRLADLVRRIADLEEAMAASERDLLLTEPDRPNSLDKRYAAFHYEALASQAAYERKLAALERRLAAIGLERHAARAVRCANHRGATTGGLRNG